MVFQNFSLIPALSVWENVALFLDDCALGDRPGGTSAAACARWRNGCASASISALPVGRLAVGDQQKVEILKQLLAGARVLILDEPTKVLAPQEAEGLFRSVAELRDDGYGIVFITHKLREVAACADRVVVMRQGRDRRLGARPRGKPRPSSLGLMFGESLPGLAPAAAPR